MKQILSFIPYILYVAVGLISLSMAQKALFAKRLLPFHENAIGVPFDKMEPSLQTVLLILVNSIGLGFLSTGILLVFSPCYLLFKVSNFIKIEIPLVCAVFCLGLFIVNFRLYKKTGVAAPWKGSLLATIAIVVGIIISLFQI
jgi:intracellular septation protein A